MMMMAGPADVRERNSKWAVKGWVWDVEVRWMDAALMMQEET